MKARIPFRCQGLCGFHNTQVDQFERLREYMVNHAIRKRGVTDTKVLNSMMKVPRHMFVSNALQNHAYDDSPLPIGSGQTMLSPFIVALMAEAANIQHTDKILEIGTGCGYTAAVLSNLAKEVHTVESMPELAASAKQRLLKLGYNNVKVAADDGSNGIESEAPFDAIVVTETVQCIPEFLTKQLAPNGRMVFAICSGVFCE